ncbi:amino acid adenylation domain-containing protein [Aquincola sp. MAHUQ-54]|uniref:Amino acid adenylation domain-containing protein n=1 Tax=Aquincola agrisoli TaxID=3119538 RepID=A0AAW9Q6N7_9BURK
MTATTAPIAHDKSLQRPAAEWVATLAQQGVRLWADGERLRCAGPDALLTDALFAELRGRRDELLSLLRQPVSPAPGATADAPAPLPRDGALPLSFAQQRLWFLEQMPQEAGVYNVPLAVRITGWLDVRVLQATLDAVVRRHEVLRTRYAADALGQSRLQIDPPAAVPLRQLDLRGDADARARLQQYLADDAVAPFDLAQHWPLRATLLRLADDEHVLALTLHHIACDAWSLDLLVAEIGRQWRAALIGTPSEPEGAQRLQYADFAAWQQQRLQAGTLESQRIYWRDRLQGAPTVLPLATDHPRPRLQTHHGAVHQFSLPAPLVDALRTLGQARSASLFMTLLAGWQLLLSRVTGQRDLLVGVPVANRQQQALEGLIGLFVNTLVLRAQVQPAEGFGTLLARVRQTTLQALSNQDLPFEQLIELLQPERDLSRHPLFQAKFRLENAAPARTELPGLVLERLPQAAIRAKLDLSMDLYETPGGIVGGIEYNADLFEPATIQRLAEGYHALLQAAAADPQRAVATLPLLGTEQRRRQLADWNTTRRPYRSDTCFHHLVEAIAAERPDDVALVFDGAPVQQLSYAQMNTRANQLAHWLRAAGVGPEVVVGIALPRSLDMIVAMLAVLKAGGAYLPLDADYPPERLAFMLSDAQVPVLLSHQGVALPALQGGVRRLDLDAAWPELQARQPAHDPAPLAGPQHLAYLIYTSGSTGRPKGVMIEHGGLVNLTEDKIRTCDVRAGDCVLNFFSFSFDASIPEIVMALATGARLLLAPPETLLPGPALASLIRRHGVTHVTMTPSALVALPPEDFSALRMVLVGGEAPSAELMQRWSTQGRRFINAYGPTETTVNASMVSCGNGAPLEATLAPAANKQMVVLDEALELLPPGAPGELCLAGVGLARGYLRRPGLTARQFVPNPFRAAGDADASPCLYRTGDLAVQGADGRIRILGRIDQQVKIRGFRVELGDIEQALAEHPAVQAAVVAALDATPVSGAKDADAGVVPDKRLAAWAVPRDAATAPSPAELREHLAQRLPRYMVPAAVQWIARIPLNANGKLDLKALATLGALGEAPERAAAIPPRNDTEAAVAAVFARVLGLPAVGIGDDFFALGGHSLLATRLVSQLLDRLSVEVTVIDLFEAPTVMGLAQRIEHKLKLKGLSAGVSAEGEAGREEFEL